MTIFKGEQPMELSDVLSEDRILLNLTAKDKLDAIRQMAKLAVTVAGIRDEAELLRKILDRESIQSTAVGSGVAIPHARTNVVQGIVVCLGVSPEGVDYYAADGKPVHLIFFVAADEKSARNYLILLSKIARLAHDDKARNALVQAKSSGEILQTIEQHGTPSSGSGV
ncbi:MAG: PTS sugar transporter subunit IIA [Planctomycetes bacterium]|nr:PTS sugar transporter subunit IIA [Planctomycetota bacterium]